jgi:hypothetical protein
MDRLDFSGFQFTATVTAFSEAWFFCWPASRFPSTHDFPLAALRLPI